LVLISSANAFLSADEYNQDFHLLEFQIWPA